MSRARYHAASRGLSAHSGGITHFTRTLVASPEAVEPALELDKEDRFLPLCTQAKSWSRVLRQLNVLQCDQ